MTLEVKKENKEITINNLDEKDTEGSRMPPKLINGEILPDVQQKMEALEAILQAPDKKRRREAMTIAAETLGKSPRTIRRMLSRIADEGVATLAVGRQDKGQYRIGDQWYEFIIETYKWGRRDGSRRNINQLHGSLMALASRGEKLRQDIHDREGFAKRLKKYPKVLEDLIAGKYPSNKTVYKIVNDYLKKGKKVRARHPGADIDNQVVQTTQGILKITHSNQIWQADHTKLDIMVIEKKEDENTGENPPKVIDDEKFRPYLTLVMDSHSGSIVGYYLGLEPAGSHEVALALRNAILPKQVKEKYGLVNEWVEHGIPEYLVTDRAKEFKCNHMKQVAMQLDFQRRLRAFPSAGGLVETIFRQINNEVLSDFGGYTGSNTKERPEKVEEHAWLTLDKLEAVLVEYFVDHHNQHEYPKKKYDSDFQIQNLTERWHSGLITEPDTLEERELDICLMKEDGRKVQKYGCIQFENLIYQGECLNQYITQDISFRYDQRNIVTLLAYTAPKDGEPGEYIGVIKARHFNHEQMALGELKWICKKLKKQSKERDNLSILHERYNQLNLIEELRHKKRKRRKKAQQIRDKATNQSKVIEIFPQNAPQHLPEVLPTQETTITATSQPSSVTPINKQQQPEALPTRRRRRSSGITVNIHDWNDYLEKNW